MSTRRRERTESARRAAGSGQGGRPGRKRTVGLGGEELGRMTISLPKEFISDIKLIATAKGLSVSAFVYQQCGPAVSEALDDMMQEYRKRARRYGHGERSKEEQR